MNLTVYIGSQEVGCDTAAKPTSKWIRGHKKRYVDPGEKSYQLPVPHGGGTCLMSTDDSMDSDDETEDDSSSSAKDGDAASR